MKRELIITADGSHSIRVPEFNVAYHSIHGAIRESMHVFINAGLKPLINQLTKPPLTLFEVGFGTGLNALLTLIEAEKPGIKIYYEAIEPYRLNETETRTLNYCQQMDRPDLQPLFEFMHQCEWEKEVSITGNFLLKKVNTGLSGLPTDQPALQSGRLFNLIYFDAFAPNAQPELWTQEIFDKMYSILAPGGILVTYCSKGDVRRAMIASGFKVEKIPGPPRKREMLRAIK